MNNLSLNHSYPIFEVLVRYFSIGPSKYHTFKHHSASRFKIENEWENIMDVLAHLPEELQEMTPPSRARSPSRSPDPIFSPVAPPSPRARSGGGVGGNRRDIKMSELLNALEGLM